MNYLFFTISALLPLPLPKRNETTKNAVKS